MNIVMHDTCQKAYVTVRIRIETQCYNRASCLIA